jgi:hypothetical protein
VDPAAVAPPPAPAAAVPLVTTLLPAPAVRVEPGAAPVAPAPQAAPAEGYFRVVGYTELSREELRDDAEESGYTVQTAISVPEATGYVRRSSGQGFLLEAKKNHLGVKTPAPTTYTLKTPDMSIHLWLGQHVNQKVHVRGLFAADNTVTVTFADKALDLGFLTDWWTKGKVRGTVLGYDGMPLVNVEVKAKSQAGYVYLANTDDTGAFAIKNLAPGTYQVWVTKVGYGVISKPVEVKSHQATTVETKLAKL